MGEAVNDLATLELIGAAQWGLVTTAAAQAAGISRVRLSDWADQGTLQRVRRGVYALPSAADGPLQGVRAAWLATATRTGQVTPTTVVSGQSAAVVHGLGEYVLFTYEFTTPVRKQSKAQDIRYRVRTLPESAITRSDGLLVTTIAQTIADLAAARGVDHEQLAVAVRDAMSVGTAGTTLARALEPSAHTAGYADGPAFLTALLDMARHQPDPEVGAVVDRFSDALVTALTPQLQQTMARIIEQFTRRSDLVAGSLDPHAISRMLDLVNQQTDVSKALGQAVTPETISRISNSMDVTLASSRRKPHAQPTREDGADDQATDPAGSGEPSQVAEREADS